VTELAGRVVVLSPHLDDAVLSLGALIARSVRSGANVEVVTVFAGDPESTAPAGDWDSRSGFRSAGEAARARRDEDRQACRILGATPVWLTFQDDQYGAHADETAVYCAIASVAAGADAVLVPGFPLMHSDHALLAELVVRESLPSSRTALYVEWPYAHAALAAGSTPIVPEALRELVPGETLFAPATAHRRDLVGKWRAVRRYRSQLPLLGRLVARSRPGAAGLIWAETRAGGETIAWLP